MSGTLSVHTAWTLLVGGAIVQSGGSLDVPKQVAAPDGTPQVYEYDVAADGKVTVWQFVKNLNENFVLLMVENIGTNDMDVQWMGDKPTSATDATPLLTHKTWNTAGLCRHSPFILNSDAILVNPAPVDHATDPGPIFHANEIDGKVYQVDVHNRDTVNVQRVRVTVVN